jgi:hypothetical protein
MRLPQYSQETPLRGKGAEQLQQLATFPPGVKAW